MCEPNGRQVRPGSIYARSLTARGVTLAPCTQARPAITRPAFPARPTTLPTAGGQSVRPNIPTRPTTLPQIGGQGQSLCEPNGRRVIPGSIYARSLTARGVTIGPCVARAESEAASTYETANTTSTPAWGVALIVLAVVVLVVLAIVIVKLVMFLKK